jgi:hypothetical protein
LSRVSGRTTRNEKWTIRFGNFADDRSETLQPEALPPEPAISAKRVVELAFPYPAKCRYRFHDIFLGITPVPARI